MRFLFPLVLCAVLVPAAGAAEPDRFARLDEVLTEGIAHGDCPGAVVLVLHRGKVVYRKAHGRRAVQPEAVPMTVDTVFDLASLTKPITTATSIMLLVEDGKLRLDDPVAKHLPGFAAGGKDKVSIEQMLLHVSGLLADNPVADYADGKDKALERICKLEPQNPPGSRFVYSDVNYIVLGALVEKVGGQTLDVFARRRIFEPLGMKETGFRPGAELRQRAAPTEKRDGQWLVGTVHDPRAALLDGVAGHAGLFSTADDLAVFTAMLLDGGRHDGKVFLSPESIKALTTPRPVPLAGGKRGLRSLGWDVDTAYSSQRGDLSRPGSGFGHTGFTGTSLWLDPDSGTAVIFLSNRVHPDGKSNVTRLRGRVASAVAAVLLPERQPPGETR